MHQLRENHFDELMCHMKGYDYSFRREITDQKGEFCPEKLHGLVEEMLSLWEEKLRANPYVKEAIIHQLRENHFACSNRKAKSVLSFISLPRADEDLFYDDYDDDDGFAYDPEEDDDFSQPSLTKRSVRSFSAHRDSISSTRPWKPLPCL